jgi:DNA-binding NtrC family response regulator
MLIKGLYGILRDEGYRVDLCDHTAHAVRQIMGNAYQAVIIDSHTLGMSAEEAVKVIKAVAPDITVILVGYPEYDTDAMSIRIPVDLEKLRELVHGMHQISSISHT